MLERCKLFLRLFLDKDVVLNKDLKKGHRTLRKIPEFYLISWCGYLAERHSVRIVSDNLPETLQKLCLSTKFKHREIGEITVFYPVAARSFT